MPRIAAPPPPSLPQATARANAVDMCLTKFETAITNVNHALDMVQRNDRAQVGAHADGLAALRELTAAFNRIRLFPPFSDPVDPQAETAVIRRRVETKLVCGYCDCVGHLAAACPKLPH